MQDQTHSTQAPAPELRAALDLLPAAARAALRHLRVAGGTTIFRRGDRPRAMYAVLSGEARLVRRSRSGGEIVFQRARGGFLAEASLDQPNYHCDAIAMCDTELASIPLARFRAALRDPEFAPAWSAMLARELRRVRAQSERLALRSARDRIVHYIEVEGRDGRLRLTQPRKDWAAELGLSHEALYRTLAGMRRNGEIFADGAELRLRRTPAPERRSY